MAGGLTNDIRFRILGDATSLQRATQAAAGHLDKIGDKLSSVGRRLTVGVSAPLAALGGAAFKTASDVVEAASKVDAVFGNQADTVKQWARTTTESFRVSRREALEAAGTFGNLFTAMGLTNESSAEMATQLVELGGDLASFNNIRTDEALEKLRSGLVGEVEPLRALGVQLNAAMVNAKALELGLADANGEVTEAAKVHARYALILEQTSTAQGDAGRTADTAAGRMAILKASFDDLKAELGERLLPVGERLLAWLDDIIAWWNRLDPVTQDWIIRFGGIAAAAGPVIWSLGQISRALTVLVRHPVVAALIAIGSAVVWAYNKFPEFREAVEAVGRWWPGFWDSFLTIAKRSIRGIVLAINDLIGAFNWITEYGSFIGWLPNVNIPDVPDLPVPFEQSYGRAKGGGPRITVQIGDQAVEDVVVKATNSARARGRID